MPEKALSLVIVGFLSAIPLGVGVAAFIRSTISIDTRKGTWEIHRLLGKTFRRSYELRDIKEIFAGDAKRSTLKVRFLSGKVRTLSLFSHYYAVEDYARLLNAYLVPSRNKHCNSG